MIEAHRTTERKFRMPISAANSFNTRDKLNVGAQPFEVHRLEKLEAQGLTRLEALPFSLRILLENLLRCEDGHSVRANDIQTLAKWAPGVAQKKSASCRPGDCCRISRAYPRWWTWRRCAKRCRKWEATPSGLTRCFPRSW